MKKDFFDTEAWKWIMVVLELLAIVAVVWLIVCAFRVAPGMAEEWDEEEYEIAYAICAKGDRVNIRRGPNTKQEPDGWLEPGDMVWLDGKRKNGFLHCVGLGIEAGEGWVHEGYLVEDPPEMVNRKGYVAANGKVRARKNVGGKQTRWLKPGGELTVYYMSDTWCVTDCGYVMTKYIELEGE